MYQIPATIRLSKYCLRWDARLTKALFLLWYVLKSEVQLISVWKEDNSYLFRTHGKKILKPSLNLFWRQSSHQFHCHTYIGFMYLFTINLPKQRVLFSTLFVKADNRLELAMNFRLFCDSCVYLEGIRGMYLIQLFNVLIVKLLKDGLSIEHGILDLLTLIYFKRVVNTTSKHLKFKY